MKLTNKKLLVILSKIKTENKKFRYKKRFSFLSKDELFKFDITIVKSSDKNEIKLDKKTVPKREVNDKMKRYVLKPRNINLNFYDWWDTVKDDDIVTLRGTILYEELFFKNLKESNTLTNNITYEIELEFIGNKNADMIEGNTIEEKHKYIYSKLQENIELILQAYQENDTIITNNEIKKLKHNYINLTGLYKYSDSMPLAITLEKQNIIQLDNKNYINSINIRRNYCVTDKTDGERHLLFFNENGELYLMNRLNNIKKTGMKCLNNRNTLLDGEYLIKNKTGKIKKFLVFDLYISNGVDFRERILNRTDKEKSENIIELSRLEE